MSKRIAIYARVSTLDQRPEIQIEALRSYANARGLIVFSEYVDHGVSGARDRRPALDRLVGDARRRRFDVVLISKLDRLARSVRHLTALAAELEALGVDLVVLDQAIDTTTPAGRLLFNVLGAIAEFERDLIRERVRAGMEAARRRGRHLGRSPAPLDEAILAQAVQQGASVSELARKLGVSRATVRRRIAGFAGAAGVAKRVAEGAPENL